MKYRSRTYYATSFLRALQLELDMQEDANDQRPTGQIYLVRLGEKGVWHDRSLTEGLLRVGWETLPLEDIRAADKATLKALVLQQFPGMVETKASNDASDLIKLRESGPEDIWVAIHRETKQLSWTRLQDGRVESDSVSNFRRTTGWRNVSTKGDMIVGLSDEVSKVNQSASRAINRMVDEGRFAAMQEAILGTGQLRTLSQQTRVPDAQITPQQRALLEEHWNKLRKPIGSTGPIGTAGHGLQAGVNRTALGWRASMYWSNSKRGNAISFCIHANRLAVEGQGPKCKRWLEAWSSEFGAREAEVRSGEPGVQDAVRFGFNYESGLRFLKHFVKRMTDFDVPVFQRWDTLPAASLAARKEVPSENPLAEMAAPADTSGAAGGYGHDVALPTAATNPWALSISEMVKNAERAAAESGTLREHEMKNKTYAFSDGQLHKLIEDLISAQGELCKLTGVRLHFLGQPSYEPVDLERLASLDRIDSARGYEEDNVQVVCRFVNKWKGIYSQEDFCRCLALVRSVEAK